MYIEKLVACILSSHGIFFLSIPTVHRLIAHQISFHILLLFSLQGYMQESAYIASQGIYTRAWLGTRIQTCPPMYMSTTVCTSYLCIQV